MSDVTDLEKRLGLSPKKERPILRKLRNYTLATVAAATIIGGAVYAFFGVDYLTKTQTFPVRNIVYKTESRVPMTLDQVAHASRKSLESNSKINIGGQATKIRDFHGKFEWSQSDDFSVYQLKDGDDQMVAEATIKEEPVQADIVSPRGLINYSERHASLKGKWFDGNQYITYSFTPQRGLIGYEVNVLEKDGVREIVDILESKRSWLSWNDPSIKRRDNTRIYGVAEVDAERLLTAIDKINADDSSKDQRVSNIDATLDILESVEHIPVLTSHEDGFIDWFPQESTTYLGSDPSTLERFADFWSFDKPDGRLRVENQWDLLPGRWPGLDGIFLGSGENRWYPFNKRNNGGYEIVDNVGTIAKVVIEDFWLHYGQDQLVHYYVDKSGDGKITDDELVGKVLFHDDFDAKEHTHTFTFMAGADPANAQEDFYLSNTIESAMTNEINRGFGKHWIGGMINNERSNIMLLENPTVENLGRALTPESSIVAKKDIKHLHEAAQRPYVDIIFGDKNE